MIRIKWLNVFYTIILIGLVSYIIWGFINVKTVNNTPVGESTCYGTLLKFCTGSDAVADYEGV